MNLTRAAVILPAAFGLSGCIAAAAIPLAAAGVIGGKAVRGDEGASSRAGVVSRTPNIRPVAMREISVQDPAPPTEEGASIVSVTNLTALPPPDGASAAQPPQPARVATLTSRSTSRPAPGSPSSATLPPLGELPPPDGRAADRSAEPGREWRALLRHVAVAVVDRPDEDAFGAPGCAERAPGVAIDAGVAQAGPQEREVASRVIESLRTMEVRVFFIGEAGAASALERAGFGGIAAEDMRAAKTVGDLTRSHCLLALGATRRDSSLAAGKEPRWGDGWFLLAGAPNQMTSINEGRTN